MLIYKGRYPYFVKLENGLSSPEQIQLFNIEVVATKF